MYSDQQPNRDRLDYHPTYSQEKKYSLSTLKAEDCSTKLAESYVAEINELIQSDFPEIDCIQRVDKKISAYRSKNEQLYFISSRTADLIVKNDFYSESLYCDLTLYRVLGELNSTSDDQVLQHAHDIHKNKLTYKLFCPTQELSENHSFFGRKYLFAGQIDSKYRKLQTGYSHLAIAWSYFRILENLDFTDAEFSITVKAVRKAMSYAEVAGEDPATLRKLHNKLSIISTEPVTKVSFESPFRNNN